MSNNQIQLVALVVQGQRRGAVTVSGVEVRDLRALMRMVKSGQKTGSMPFSVPFWYGVVNINNNQIFSL